MKLRVMVDLEVDGHVESLEPFELGVPYGIERDDVDERMVDLLNTAVNWTDVVNDLLRQHRGRLGILPEQIELRNLQMQQQNKPDEGSKDEEKTQ